MTYEVEQKFRVDGFEDIRRQLEALSAAFPREQYQVDSYFTHPARDFAVTDEALRIRRVGDDCYITYKGPKIDASTKTRREIELPLPPGALTYDQFSELLEALGFRRLVDVRKRRSKVHVPWQECVVEVSLDEVEQVGRYVELELTAEADEMDGARRCVRELAERLQLNNHERRSYLELLLQNTGR